jgi:hypothetical protein
MRRTELAETEKIKCYLESLIGEHVTAPQTWCRVVVRVFVDEYDLVLILLPVKFLNYEGPSPAPETRVRLLY